MGNSIFDNNIINEKYIKNNQELFKNQINKINWKSIDNIGLLCCLTYFGLRFENIIFDFFCSFDKSPLENNFVIKSCFTIEKTINDDLSFSILGDIDAFFRQRLKIYDTELDPLKLKEWVLFSVEIKELIYEKELINEKDYIKINNFILFNRKTFIIEYIDFSNLNILNENNKLKIFKALSNCFGLPIDAIKEHNCLNDDLIQSIFPEYQKTDFNGINKNCSIFSILYIHLKLLGPVESFKHIKELIQDNRNSKYLKQIFNEYIYYIKSFCLLNHNLEFINQNEKFINEKFDKIELCFENICKIFDSLSNKTISLNEIINKWNEIYLIQSENREDGYKIYLTYHLPTIFLD